MSGERCDYCGYEYEEEDSFCPVCGLERPVHEQSGRKKKRSGTGAFLFAAAALMIIFIYLLIEK